MLGAVLRFGWRRAEVLWAARRQPVEPDQGIVDLIGFEPMRAELAPQLLEFGAGIAAPVVFVHENEHFKHAPI